MRRYIERLTTVLVGLGLVIFVVRAVGTQRLVRQFNKHLLNPFALWLVARRPMYYGVIHHVGRHSGHEYSTPIVAKLTTDGVIIPLPYGANTDWCRNLFAAGHATLTLHGSDYDVDHPLIVDEATAAPLVPAATAHVWHRMGIEKYVHLEVQQGAGSELARAA